MKTAHWRIAQLRQESMLKMIEALGVFVFALFMSAMLPQILFKYFYANQVLTEEPAIFEYITTGSFALSVGYFVFAAVGNMMRCWQVRKLEKAQMCACGDGSCEGCDEAGDCCGGCCGEACCDSGSCSGKDDCRCDDCMTTPAVEMMKKAGGSKRKTSKK